MLSTFVVNDCGVIRRRDSAVGADRVEWKGCPGTASAIGDAMLLEEISLDVLSLKIAITHGSAYVIHLGVPGVCSVACGWGDRSDR